MKIRVIKNHWLFKFLPSWVEGVAVGRLIITRSVDPSPALLIHEYIHQEQIERHGVFIFYVLYIFRWLLGLLRYRSFGSAYYLNPFEVEAYVGQDLRIGEWETIRKKLDLR